MAAGPTSPSAFLISRIACVPTPMQGDTERLVLWSQVLTGLELDANEEVQPLSANRWQERRRRLEELGKLTEAGRRGCTEVFLEVRTDNDRAQRLYRRYGFVGIGVRRGYYQPSGADALVMRHAIARARPAEPATRARGTRRWRRGGAA